MRVAVIDDSKKDLENLANMLLSFKEYRNISMNIICYKNGAEFLHDFHAGKFAVIFLDIYMDGIDGMKVAYRLRERDNDCLLVFVTNSDRHAIEAYWVRAFHYLVKPYTQTEFDRVMEVCCEELNLDSKYIELKEGRIYRKIMLKDIFYADMHAHYVQVHTPREIIKSRMYFTDISGQLCDSRFLQCYRNIIVNMEQIQTLRGYDFILKSGERIPIQRKMYPSSKQIFADYLFQREKRRHI